MHIRHTRHIGLCRQSVVRCTSCFCSSVLSSCTINFEIYFSGYGDITPCTIWGQLLAILFALIGIPLFLVSLTHLGKWLEDALNALYLWLKGLLKKKQKNRTFDKKKLNEINDIDFVPLSVGLGVTLLWTIFASIYFYFILQQYYNDNFNFFTAIYFTLVSFLTIGLGEISPVNYQLTLITSIFIVMGLALVTMCIEIAQTKLEIILHNMKLLIEKEFKNNLAFGKIPSNDSKAAKNLLKKLFQEEPNAKYFSLFISDRDKNQLIESYRSLSNQVSKSVQTENKRTADNSTNTIQVEDKPEEEEEPKRLIIRYTKKHPNKIGYKT